MNIRRNQKNVFSNRTKYIFDEKVNIENIHNLYIIKVLKLEKTRFRVSFFGLI